MKKCGCSWEGQCRGCQEEAIYKAGFWAGQLNKAVAIVTRVEEMQKTISRIEEILKAGK